MSVFKFTLMLFMSCVNFVELIAKIRWDILCSSLLLLALVYAACGKLLCVSAALRSGYPVY